MRMTKTSSNPEEREKKCCRKKGGLHHKDIYKNRQRHRNQVHREMSRADLRVAVTEVVQGAVCG
jgi:hypothetical protein